MSAPVAADRLGVPRGTEIVVDPRSRDEARVGEADHPRLTSRNGGLDLLRATGAALVFATHLYFGFGQSWLGSIGDGGWLGVYIFFPLSGYLLARPFLRGDVQLGRYAVSRLARLGPAYYLALFGIILIGGAPAIAASPLPALTLTGNTFGDTLRAGWFGQSWTLGVEALFYVLLPLVARRTRLVIALVALSALFAATLPSAGWGHDQLLAQFWAFGLGVLAARWEPRLAIAGRLWPLGVAVLVLALVARGSWALQAYLGTAGATWLILAAAWRRPSITWARWPADLSYAVYLWHVAVTVLLFHAGLAGPALVPVAVACTVAVAAASYVLVERPVMRWASRLDLRAGVAVTPREVREAGI